VVALDFWLWSKAKGERAIDGVFSEAVPEQLLDASSSSWDKNN